MTRATVTLSLLFSVAQGLAQLTGPTFEAASIKPSKAQEDGSSWHSRTGYLVIRNQRLIDCIAIAWKVKAEQVTGGPKWIRSERFDIEARAASPAGDPELLVMLQKLLAERFRVELHRDTKMVSGYALVVAKGGLKVRPVEAGGRSRSHSTKGKMTAERLSMAKLAESLSRLLGAPAVDMTGATGLFSFQLEWNPESAQPIAPGAAAVAELPVTSSLFTVLPEQLGVKLESRRTPVEMLVVDKAERPTEN